MNRKAPLAAFENVPLEQLAVTAQMLADGLVAAAERSCSASAQHRPRLQLVGVNGGQPGGDASPSTQVRSYLRARRLRDGLFPEGIFADPAWDMLLDLYACRLEGTEVCVSNACIAARVPHSTALRWVDRLEEFGLVERRPDPVDSRRIYVGLTDVATWRIELWLKAAFHADPQA